MNIHIYDTGDTITNNKISLILLNDDCIHQLIDNYNTITYNLPDWEILIYANDDISNNVKNILHNISDDIIYYDSELEPFSIMNGAHDKYIIHMSDTPVDIYNICKWIESDLIYLHITTGNTFTFGGKTNNSFEFFGWYNNTEYDKYIDFFDNHIKFHILHSSLEISTPHNVASFSIWGDNLLYTDGMKHNIKLMYKYFPEWECRIYIDDSVAEDIVQYYTSHGAIIYVRDNSVDSSGMMWRFEVMFDINIDLFIIRDADSRITYREVLAINEWMLSGKSFHVMRDNIQHNTAILGGMWGGRVRKTMKYKDIFYSIDVGTNKGSDQLFLTRVLWNDVKHDMICHDTYKNFRPLIGIEKDFPIPIQNGHYVGEIIKRYDESGEFFYED